MYCMYVCQCMYQSGAGYFIDCPSQPERYVFRRACISNTRRIYDILWGFYLQKFFRHKDSCLHLGWL